MIPCAVPGGIRSPPTRLRSSCSFTMQEELAIPQYALAVLGSSPIRDEFAREDPPVCNMRSLNHHPSLVDCPHTYFGHEDATEHQGRGCSTNESSIPATLMCTWDSNVLSSPECDIIN